MIAEDYVWFTWSTTFLVPWALLFWRFPQHRKSMLWASVFTMPFGLTEPLFVPEYWMPPSLFALARRTGFDIESLIFCFAIGGVGAALYNIITRRTLRPLPRRERRLQIHRYHYVALAAPLLLVAGLYLFPWNPIYPAILAMAFGSAAAIWCRPDLGRKTWIGGLLFLGYYVVFLVGLMLSAPGYIERVWNMNALTGVTVAGMPVEELLFAFTFGAYWSGVYEHFTWSRADSAAGRGRPASR